MAAMQTAGQAPMQHKAATACRQLLSSAAPPIQLVVVAGAVPRLAALLTLKAHPEIQQEAAWALSLIASGNTAQTLEVARVLPVLVSLLESLDTKVKEHVLLTIGNIAGDGPAMRDEVLVHNMRCCYLTADYRLSLTRSATSTLANLCRGSRPPPARAHVDAALPALKYLVGTSQDKETLSDACWAINYLSMGSSERLQAVLKADLAKPIVGFLKLTDEPTVVLPALQIVGNVVSGTEAHTNYMLSFKTLPLLRSLLTHADARIIKETCWALSNVAAGTCEQGQNIIESAIIPTVVNVAENGEHRCRIEACYVIANMFQSSADAHVIYTVDAGGLGALVANLDVILDSGHLNTFLKGVYHALKVGDLNDQNFDDDIEEMPHGIGTLERMAEHHDECVAKNARAILDEYFPEVSDDED
eukprot:gene15455-22240_t